MMETENILDEMRIGTESTIVPVDYILDPRRDEQSYLKRIYQRHTDRVVEQAQAKAARKARQQIIKHTIEIEQQVPKDKRAKLTALYSSKYKDRLTMVGLKRFILGNKDMSSDEIDLEFNRVHNWAEMDMGDNGALG